MVCLKLICQNIHNYNDDCGNLLSKENICDKKYQN
jgi:hypothetical protein